MFEDMDRFLINKQYTTLDELLEWNYGDTQLAKSDVPAYTGTSGYRNRIYGKKMWMQMNIKPNTFTAIPRKPYEQSGYRLVADFATTATTGSGVAESTSTIPDAKVPAITMMNIGPKTLINDPYAFTLVMENMTKSDDVVTLDGVLEILGKEFPMRVNNTMVEKNTANTASAGYNFESIDRLISGYEEKVAHSGIAAGAVDIFGIDRHSGATAFDAKVSAAAANREFKLSHIDGLFTATMPYWNDYVMDEKVIITGFDTIERMQTLAQSQQRFVGWNNYQVTYNGVKTLPGDAIGFGVSQYRGVPVVADQFIKNDSALSRLYLIDTSTMQLGMLLPPTFITDRNYLARKALTVLATYFMAGELVCNKFRANGKVMDIA